MAKGWATEDADHNDQHYEEHGYCRVLMQATNRLFVLRGQIVHGASSGRSGLNRSSVHYSLETLKMLMPVVQHIVIEYGCHDDWPELCYPPLG